MHLPAHAALGWIVGTAAPGTDRRLRNWCVLASCAPDIDGVTYVGGPLFFAHWHHTFGHTVWLGGLLVAAAMAHDRGRGWARRLLTGFCVAFCFASHLFTDATMTGWSVMPWWPFSRQQYMWWNSWQLGDPINVWAIVVGVALCVPLALWRGATPFDVLSPKLDRVFLNAFRRRTLECGACGTRCNNSCETCSKPCCMKHGALRWNFSVVCVTCNGNGGGKAGG